MWKGDGAAYASPVLLTVDGLTAVVAETADSIVAITPAEGKELWKRPFKVRYNACTPVVDGQTVIYSGSGSGTYAVTIEKQGDKLTSKDLWKNTDVAVQFDTPVVKDGLVYGVTDDDKLFCLDGKTGKLAWSAPMRKPTGGRTRPGYGSVVDAGSVLFTLNPSGELIAFEPTDKEFKKVANYKVAEGGTYAYPVIADKRLFIKDANAVTLWMID
jgi:outer membrane protein assembly factor BamB